MEHRSTASPESERATALACSIVIINYNYARFLPQCITSALEQTYPYTEVIVVDDGSTDGSRQVISGFGDSVRAVFQPNRGMLAASNAGFEATTGDLVHFLDADDYLYPDAMARVVQAWSPDIAKLHFRLDRVNGEGKKLGHVPRRRYILPDGDLTAEILRSGVYVSVPTSGNVYARRALQQVLPLKPLTGNNSGGYLGRLPTDPLLAFRVPFFGQIAAIQAPLGAYRMHGGNNGAGHKVFSGHGKMRRSLRIAYENKQFLADLKGIAPASDRLDDLFLQDSPAIVDRLMCYELDGASRLWPHDSRLRLFRRFFGRFPHWPFRTRFGTAREMIYAATLLGVLLFRRRAIAGLGGRRMSRFARSARLHRKARPE